VNLMQGPVTVFDAGTYAGDARIMDLQPNDERLLTYAVDLGTEVEAKSKSPPSRITAVSLKKGLAHLTTRQREEKTYHAVNRGQDAKTLLVEHPYRPAFRLANDLKPAERTRDQYRFELKLPAGKAADLDVVEEQDITQAVQLTNADDQQIRFFLQQPVLSKAVREALEKAADLHGKLSSTQRDLEQVKRQLQQIEADQGRLRENLKATPATAAAYKRYLDKLDAQEAELEKLQARRDQLQAQEHQARQSLDGFLMALNVE
jgi:DNA repair exonuclease SbcCD ATPase subunit